MRTAIALVVVGLFAAPVLAISNPHVAGSMQGWDPGSDAMTETAPGSGIYTKTYTGLDANARHEFKITDGSWGSSHPGPNSWLFTDGDGNITITYDSNTYADGWSPTTDRLGLSADPGNWTAVGSFQGWDNVSPATAMQAQGGGIYKLEVVLAPGNYDWKAVVTGSWDSISWDARSVNTANWGFATDATNNTVRFWVDALAGTAKVEVVPEPTMITLALLGGLGLLLRRR